MTTNLLRDIESAARPVPNEHSAIERLILKHAMRSFGKRGYAGTTLRGIAAEAGVTAPMVGYYFQSKEGLFQKVAEIVMSSLESEVRASVDGTNGFLETVQAIAQAHVQLAERSPSAVEFMFAMLYGPQEDQPQPDIEGMYGATRRTMADVFERGIASGELEPRKGMSVGFLVEQLGSLLHDHVSRKFRLHRFLERHPERRSELEARADDWTLDIALDHFFFGAGELRRGSQP
jgi:AcrR family transcriptional regulator